MSWVGYHGYSAIARVGDQSSWWLSRRQCIDRTALVSATITARDERHGFVGHESGSVLLRCCATAVVVSGSGQTQGESLSRGESETAYWKVNSKLAKQLLQLRVNQDYTQAGMVHLTKEYCYRSSIGIIMLILRRTNLRNSEESKIRVCWTFERVG